MSAIGDVLRAARKRAGLTQTEAAHRAGFAFASTVCSWEKGAREPSLDSLRKYAAALGTTATALVAEWETS